MTPPPKFLTIEDVLVLHAIAIEDQGGRSYLRDRALLESAVAMPQQTVGDQFLHEDISAMAAAYAFHICSNHPFIDGNKRAAVAAMIAFLVDNEWEFIASADEAEPVIIQLASGAIAKSEFSQWLRAHVRPRG